MELLDTNYSLCYLGQSTVNSYVTDSTLPWIIAEVELSRRLQNVSMHLSAQEIELKRDFISRIPSSSGNSVTTPDGLESLAEDLMKFDDLDTVCVGNDTADNSIPSAMESLLKVTYDKIMQTKKIQRNQSSYFILIVHESKDKPIYCHTFKADTNIISIICNDIEKRILLKGKNGLSCIFNKTDNMLQEHSDNDCVRFEVMLVGIVNLKNPDPPHTLIDQAVTEFDERYKNLELRRNGAHGNIAASHIPLSPGYIDSGSPPSSYMDDSREGSVEMLRQMRQRCSSFGHDAGDKPLRRSRQRHQSEPSTNAGDARKTRVRLFQIGHNSIKMVCPNKTVRTCEIEFSNISRCMQGIKNRDHFGMIANSREPQPHSNNRSTSKKVICYVFKCADENVCEEIMQGIRQAFATCYSETSPMEEFDLLCTEINAAATTEALSIAKRRILNLDETEKQMIKAQVTEINPKNQGDKLAAIMSALRRLYEVKHIKHLEETKAAASLGNQHVGPDGSGSKFDSIRNKAMLSFGSLIQKGKKKMQELQLDAEHLSEKHVTSPVQRLKQFSDAFSAPATPQKGSPKLDGSPGSPSGILNFARSRTRSTSLGSKPHGMDFHGKSKDEVPFLFYHKIFYNITNTGPYAKSSSSTCFSTPMRPEKPEKHYQSVEDIRRAWKWAIKQQILMNKINSIATSKPSPTNLPNSPNEYSDLSTVPDEMENVWMELFRLSTGEGEKIETKLLHAAVKKGVLSSYRGRVWKLLRAHCHNDDEYGAKNDIGAYQRLLDNLTPYQHAILIDIGRTFPTHPVYSQLLGPGQLSLFNVLKAYSLLDKEVGYCQGLSFIAGVLLMHTCIEDEAYQLLYCIMHEIGCRSMYLPDMKGMKLAMYKMTRLLHDIDLEIFSFFEKHEVTMMLVATPWFLTMFASTFPMGFVARVFDMVFVDGTAALFKTAICLLQEHKSKFTTLDDFEDIVNYIKTEIPRSETECLNRVIDNAMDMFIDRKLYEYEVEYRILCEELQITSYYAENQKSLEEQVHCLENVNHKVTESNCDLLHQLHDAQQRVAVLQRQLKDGGR